MFKKSAGPYQAIMAYRSTLLDNVFSPEKLVMSKNRRKTHPIAKIQLLSKVIHKTGIERKEYRNREKFATNSMGLYSFSEREK